jgi:hypothetical protein
MSRIAGSWASGARRAGGSDADKTVPDNEPGPAPLDVDVSPLEVGWTDREVVFRLGGGVRPGAAIPERLRLALDTFGRMNKGALAGRRIVFDLGGRSAIDSHELGILLYVRRALIGYGAVYVRNLSPAVDLVFRLAGLVYLFEVEAGEGEGGEGSRR